MELPSHPKWVVQSSTVTPSSSSSRMSDVQMATAAKHKTNAACDKTSFHENTTRFLCHVEGEGASSEIHDSLNSDSFKYLIWVDMIWKSWELKKRTFHNKIHQSLKMPSSIARIAVPFRIAPPSHTLERKLRKIREMRRL